MYDGQADGGADGLGEQTYQGGYGLGGFFDVIAAPFKAAAKGAKFVATKAVPFAVRTGAGFAQASGLPIISQAGGIVSQLTRRRAATSPYDPNQGMYATLPFQPQGPQSWQTPMYPGTGPVTDLKTQVFNVLNDIKNAALGTAAQRIAETPQGQAAIQAKITGDISRYMLPAAAGLVVVLLLTRR